MVSAYQFGRAARMKVAQTPGISSAPTSFWDSWMNPPTPAASSGAPTSSPYMNALDRWYNPWTQQTGREAGEQGLMRAGQAAMGVGAGAATLAGGIAAAPAVTGAVTAGAQQAGAGLAAAGTAIGTQANRIGTAAGNVMNQIGTAVNNTAARLPQTAQNAMTRLNQGVQAYNDNVKPVLDRLDYKPQDVALDGYAAATGNFDKIKGPGWGVKFPGGSMPLGAPTMPKPYQFAQTLQNSHSNFGQGGLLRAGANLAK